MPDLRKPFVDKMIELAENDPKVILITCDLGFSFLERFAEKFPKQYINAGIAEQNAIGVAAGLALGGFRPYVYSNTIFLLSRGHEFVRNEVAYNNLNVKLVGTKAAGFLGFSHNLGVFESAESWLKGMPNIKQFSPLSEEELGKSLINNGPSFIQL